MYLGEKSSDSSMCSSVPSRPNHSLLISRSSSNFEISDTPLPDSPGRGLYSSEEQVEKQRKSGFQNPVSAIRPVSETQRAKLVFKPFSELIKRFSAIRKSLLFDYKLSAKFSETVKIQDNCVPVLSKKANQTLSTSVASIYAWDCSGRRTRYLRSPEKRVMLPVSCGFKISLCGEMIFPPAAFPVNSSSLSWTEVRWLGSTAAPGNRGRQPCPYRPKQEANEALI